MCLSESSENTVYFATSLHCLAETVDPATLLSCYQCGIDGAPACDAQEVGNLSPKKCSSSDKYCVSVKATTSK